MYYIGIDAGVSYLKICLIDGSGKEVSVFKYKIRYLKDDGLFKELDPLFLTNKILEAINNIKNNYPVSFKSIKSISITSHGCTFILLDRNKNEITNFISVFDKRSKRESRELNSRISIEDNYRISGHRENSELFTATKLLWFRNNKKNIFNEISKVLFLEDYLIFKLTGILVTERSIASISGMFDLEKNSWREDILEITGIKKKMLPDIMDGGTYVGTISREVSDATGLNKDVKVITGLLDALANSIGAGNVDFNNAVECTGTVLSIITNTEKPLYNNLKIPINYFFNNIYALLPFSPTAGILIDWFGKNFYSGTDYYLQMENEIGGLKILEDDPFCLPYFIDTSIIHDNIKSRGVFFGINLKHGKRHLCRSIYESIGFILKENILTLEHIKKMKFETIVSVGGASESSLLSQYKADILNKEIAVIKNKEVGCLGVAILSALANEDYKNLKEAVKNMVQIKKVYEPENNMNLVYEKRYKMFNNILNNAKIIFKNNYEKS